MSNAREMYIELMKKALTDYHRIGMGEYKPLYENYAKWRRKPIMMVDRLLRKMNYAVCKKTNFNVEDRLNGKDWPANADTMIGLKRLDNIQHCVLNVIQDQIPGDFIETGVWRGGSIIFMKALLKVWEANDRIVWVADSFEGLPAPNEALYPADKGDMLYTMKELAISMEVVQNNFRKYDLLDENVRFVKGWFKDTLPTAPIDRLSILRVDGDLYESTMDALVPLYPKLSKGGYVIIDDYGTLESCRQAVEDYRRRNNITEEIIPIDWSGVYWRKS